MPPVPTRSRADCIKAANDEYDKCANDARVHTPRKCVISTPFGCLIGTDDDDEIARRREHCDDVRQARVKECPQE